MNEIVSRGLSTGAALAATTATTMMISSALERGSPWAGLNAMATAVGVSGRRVGDRFDRDVTPTGFAALTGGLLLWGVGYEALLEASGRRSSWVTGMLSGLGGYALDRFILPQRLLPSFRRKMGVTGTVAKYAVLALASTMFSGGRGAAALRSLPGTLGTVGRHIGTDQGISATMA